MLATRLGPVHCHNRHSLSGRHRRLMVQGVEEMGGPCRGRTYGPLIKSDKWPFLTKLATATVSPISLAIPRSWSLLFIPCYSFLSIPFRSCLVTSFQGFMTMSQSNKLIIKISASSKIFHHRSQLTRTPILKPHPARAPCQKAACPLFLLSCGTKKPRPTSTLI